MSKLATIVRARTLNSLRIFWVTVLTSMFFLFVMVAFKFLPEQESSTFLKLLTPSQIVALIIAIGALLVSYDVLSKRAVKSARTRVVVRSLFTEDDIYLLYTSPISTQTIVFGNLLSNLVIFTLAIMPLGLGIIISFLPVHGIDAIYATFVTLIFLILAYVHGLSLYTLMMSPRGILSYSKLRNLYFTILGLTLIGPALSNTNLFFISPSATFADAIVESVCGHPGIATLLAIAYFLIPLYLLYIFSREDYVLKPLDILSSIETIKEIIKTRVRDFSSFIKLIYYKSPIMILSYILLPIAFIPLIVDIAHITYLAGFMSGLSSFMLYIVILVTFSPADLVYSSGVIVGISSWFFYQTTKPNREIVNNIVKESIIRTAPLIATLITVLGIESLLYGLQSALFGDFLVSVIVLPLLIPVLRIEANMSIIRGLKIYMKSGNLPLAVDPRTLKTIEEEMKDRILFALHYLPLFGAAVALAYGVYFVSLRLTIIGMSLIIAGAVIYSIAIALARVVERHFRP